MLPVTATGCIEWPGSRDAKGYGRVRGDSGQWRRAHAVAYENHVGSIPDRYEIDHLCRNPSCVNPEHLEAVTHRENVLRGVGPAAINARKQQCKHGHPFDVMNTYVDTYGRRVCRTCRRAMMKRRRLAEGRVRKPASCGTRAKYNNGCRCDRCRGAQASYMRGYRPEHRKRLRAP